jgi:hypothetical protein
MLIISPSLAARPEVAGFIRSPGMTISEVGVYGP